jgi:hypothetical protein
MLTMALRGPSVRGICPASLTHLDGERVPAPSGVGVGVVVAPSGLVRWIALYTIWSDREIGASAKRCRSRRHRCLIIVRAAVIGPGAVLLQVQDCNAMALLLLLDVTDVAEDGSYQFF